ncbi:hypothetical protein KUCAC02_037001 [Xyrichtys novacula]|uniref:Uncharacterized protein n=1 Tax=Xyrichtys novacula TaxID=13765 RepID=A0AAV1HJR2_XYRNO|nr:hypothetical protein KUCAC02_037001 [Xyrichtys novacula]
MLFLPFPRMALRKLLNSQAASPYGRLPPLHITFLNVADTPRVVAWAFDGSSASPTCTKNNKTAIISDGESLAKVVLFEAVAGRVAEGQAYYMRGHTLMGTAPPFTINVGTGTQFFRGGQIHCPAELVARAEALLHPASPLIALHQCREQQGLMSVEGVIVEMSAVMKMALRKEATPLRKLLLQQDQSNLKVSLWREAAVESLIVGETVRLTHMKLQNNEYGIQVNSTHYTKIERQQASQHLIIVGVLTEGGATSGPQEATYEVLLEGGETLHISKALWEPSYDEALQEGPLKAKATVKGKNITAISAL